MSARHDLAISLLHATYRASTDPRTHGQIWRDAADHPERVEHVCALDDDDQTALSTTGDVRRVVGPGDPSASTAVRNWNSAGTIATGGLLVVIADDLFPCAGWDSLLTDLVGSLDPHAVEFVIKVRDDPSPEDVLLRHPVMSRAFHRRHGVFSPRYSGVYCDNDLTLRAFWSAAILDGRSIVFDHRHPALATAEHRSASQNRINDRDEYARGRRTFTEEWSAWRRSTRVSLIAPASGPMNSATLHREARRLRRRATLPTTLSYLGSSARGVGRSLRRHLAQRGRVT